MREVETGIQVLGLAQPPCCLPAVLCGALKSWRRDRLTWPRCRPLPRFCIQDRPSTHRLRLPEPRGKTPRVVFDAPNKGCPSAHLTPQSGGRENGLPKIFIREQGVPFA